MEWEIARTTIAAIAVLVTVYFYVRRIETNHIDTLRKDIREVREKLDEHIQWHLDHPPNPGGSDG